MFSESLERAKASNKYGGKKHKERGAGETVNPQAFREDVLIGDRRPSAESDGNNRSAGQSESKQRAGKLINKETVALFLRNEGAQGRFVYPIGKGAYMSMKKVPRSDCGEATGKVYDALTRAGISVSLYEGELRYNLGGETFLLQNGAEKRSGTIYMNSSIDTMKEAIEVGAHEALHRALNKEENFESVALVEKNIDFTSSKYHTFLDLLTQSYGNLRKDKLIKEIACQYGGAAYANNNTLVEFMKPIFNDSNTVCLNLIKLIDFETKGQLQMIGTDAAENSGAFSSAQNDVDIQDDPSSSGELKQLLQKENSREIAKLGDTQQQVNGIGAVLSKAKSESAKVAAAKHGTNVDIVITDIKGVTKVTTVFPDGKIVDALPEVNAKASESKMEQNTAKQPRLPFAKDKEKS